MLTPNQILEGIRDADYQRPGLRCLKLFRMEADYFAKLGDEAERLCRRNDPSDALRFTHVTSWARPYGTVLQFSLLNRSGRYEDTSCDHDQSCLGKRFHDVDGYPALADFIRCFPHCLNFRLNVLGAHSGLRAHEEHVTLRLKSGKVGLRARFHLPLRTNDQAEVMLDGRYYHLSEGIVYFFNNGCAHSAKNPRPRQRLHLVWDMLMTSQALHFMFGESKLHDLPMKRFRGRRREVDSHRFSKAGSCRRLARWVTESDAQEVSQADIQ